MGPQAIVINFSAIVLLWSEFGSLIWSHKKSKMLSITTVVCVCVCEIAGGKWVVGQWRKN